MERTAELKERAKAQFAKVVKEKVDWIAARCWPCNIAVNLKEMNNIIEAGQKMEVTTAIIFNEEEIKKLVEDFTPLRTLKMDADIKALLIRTLEDKGIHHEVFAE